jgi:nitroreductase
MNILEVIKKRRSIRLFNDKEIDRQDLIDMIDAARRAPSAANKQPLEYILVTEDDICERIFDTLAWAAYVTPRRNPPAGKRPTAYIVVLINNEISIGEFGRADAGAAIENILLTAVDKGIGSCWLGSVDREKVSKTLGIPDKYSIDSVLALGYPDENPIMEETQDQIEYYLDENNTLHVPKRSIESILHEEQF